MEPLIIGLATCTSGYQLFFAKAFEPDELYGNQYEITNHKINDGQEHIT